MARASRQRGDPYLDLALLTDGLRAEREQGITIDVAYRYFSTAKRKFIIADTPGHIQYTRNMVTGASTAELAIVLIDARNGVITQSQAPRLPGLAAADSPHPGGGEQDGPGRLRQDVFQAIVDDYRAFASKLTVQDITFIPISRAARRQRRAQKRGHALVRRPHADAPPGECDVGSSRNLVDFRFPVQMALRPHQNFRGFAGQIASGSIMPGEEVVVLPSGKASRVRTVTTLEDDLAEAAAGDSVVLSLEDEIDISRGDMIVRRNNLPQTATQLDCILCWMSEEPLNLKGSYILQHTTRQVRAFVATLNYRIDVDTLHREAAHTLQLNEIARVRLTTTQPIFYDPYQINRATGAFILIDPFTNNTVAAGMIRREAQNLEDLVSAEPERRKSSNVVWEGSALTRAMREERNGHKGAVLWFTGLSGSGKSTVARLLERRLYAAGVQTFYLDGDNVRHGLNGDLGFSAEDRKENIRRVAEVAKLAFEHGSVVICTFISPFAADRDFARTLIPDPHFLEIYVKCDLEVVKRRDPKGLYARALRGEIPEFTGVSSPYEAPAAAELVVETDVRSAEEIVEEIWEELIRRGVAP
jgi:bifunctional enzyme CysN/CysC